MVRVAGGLAAAGRHFWCVHFAHTLRGAPAGTCIWYLHPPAPPLHLPASVPCIAQGIGLDEIVPSAAAVSAANALSVREAYRPRPPEPTEEDADAGGGGGGRGGGGGDGETDLRDADAQALLHRARSMAAGDDREGDWFGTLFPRYSGEVG